LPEVAAGSAVDGDGLEAAGADEGAAVGGGDCASEVAGAGEDGFAAGCDVGIGEFDGAGAADEVAEVADESVLGVAAGALGFGCARDPTRGKPSRRQRSQPNPPTRASATTSSSIHPLWDFGSSSSSR